METSKNKTFILLAIALSLLIVALMFGLGVLDIGKYLTKGPVEIADDSSVTEAGFERSSFDCPQFESLTASEQEELSNKIREIILEYTGNNMQVDNEILITEFPKCFTGPDS